MRMPGHGYPCAGAPRLYSPRGPGPIMPGPIPGPIMAPGMSVRVTSTTVPGSAGTSHDGGAVRKGLPGLPSPAVANAAVDAIPSAMDAVATPSTSRKPWVVMEINGVRAAG